MYRWRCITFDDWQKKALYLDGVAWVDARILPVVREVGRRIARPHGAMGPQNAGAVTRDLYRLVRDRVRYVSDPASEEFSDAQQVLEQGEGDCDDKVRAFVALCRSVRVEAHIRPVMRQGEFAHVQAVVRFPGSDTWPHALPDGWLVAELILAEAELGDDVQDVPLDAQGRPRYA